MTAKAFHHGDTADFTRWNRSGLSRFRYGSEAAAELTETLRLAHLLLYARGQAPADIDPIEDWRHAFETGTFRDGETVRQKLNRLGSVSPRSAMDGMALRNATYTQRLLAQYQAVLTEPSAQMSRAFARALHVLIETIDAYANEGTLRTATQTEHALHLLSLIGYRPRPAASAVMPIACLLKPAAARLTLPAGIGAEYALPDGGAVLSFESLHPIDAHAALNVLRAQGHDAQRDAIAPGRTDFVLNSISPFSTSLIGGYAVLADGDWADPAAVRATDIEAVRVSTADRSSARITLQRGIDDAVRGDVQTARFLSAAATRLAVRPRGGGWLHFASAPETFPQAIVLAQYNDGSQALKRVAEIRGRDIRLVPLGPVFSMDLGEIHVLDDTLRLAGTGGYTAFIWARTPRPADTGVIEAIAVYATMAAAPDDDGDDIIDMSSGGVLGSLPFGWQPQRLKKGASLGQLVTLSATAVYVENASQEALEKTGFALFETASRAYAQPFEVDEYEPGSLRITPVGRGPDPLRVTALHVDFRSVSGFVADLRSRAPLLTDDGQVTLICPRAQQDMLRPGRLVMLQDDEGGDCDTALIEKVMSQSGDLITLRLQAGAVDLSAYRRGFTTIRGNVAQFGHGKSLPARVLGSGDGSIGGQQMPIDDPQVSTRLDPAFPGGVAADVEITVNGRIWQQIAPDVAPADDTPSYHVLPQPDGALLVRFGLRLPSGSDNVMLTRIRTGAGARGNAVPPYGITNLKPKHSAVSAVVQPLAPQAGADAETLDTLRHDGRSNYTLFGRALGVTDFARLAEEHSGVVHAHATLIRQRGMPGSRLLRLVIAPQGGTGLDLIRNDVQAMLLRASQPGTRMQIIPFRPAHLIGSVRVGLSPGYPNALIVQHEIEAMLDRAFGLAARSLGRALYVSEIATVIEAHRAVDHVIVALTGPCGMPGVTCKAAQDGTVQAVLPDAMTSVYLADPADLGLIITPATRMEGG